MYQGGGISRRYRNVFNGIIHGPKGFGLVVLSAARIIARLALGSKISSNKPAGGVSYPCMHKSAGAIIGVPVR
jgi:hypothetical protein